MNYEKWEWTLQGSEECTQTYHCTQGERQLHLDAVVLRILAPASPMRLCRFKKPRLGLTELGLWVKIQPKFSHGPSLPPPFPASPHPSPSPCSGFWMQALPGSSCGTGRMVHILSPRVAQTGFDMVHLQYF